MLSNKRNPVSAEILVAMITPALLISAAGALVLSNIMAEFNPTTDVDAAIIREACSQIDATI
jgi:hypothetical protein